MANGVTVVRNVDYFSTPNNDMKWTNATVRRWWAQAAAGTRWSPRIYASAA